jgi:hypothetical protein
LGAVSERHPIAEAKFEPRRQPWLASPNNASAIEIAGT